MLEGLENIRKSDFLLLYSLKCIKIKKENQEGLVMKTKTQKMVIAAMFTAITCVVTMIIKIPSPFKGYLNLGDAVVLLSGWFLSPGYGFMAAGMGSAIADIASGYTVYAPITFVIKGIMAFVANSLYRVTCKRTEAFLSRIISGISAETIMIFGYFMFEGVLYGFAVSILNLPVSAVQGFAGLAFGMIAVRIIEKINVKNNHIKH